MLNKNPDHSGSFPWEFLVRFYWTRSYQVFGFWDISDHWKMITLFVRHSVNATILKSNIWNRCYNRDMVKKCSMTKMFFQLFQPSMRKCIWFSAFSCPISENGSFSSSSSCSSFSSLNKLPCNINKSFFQKVALKTSQNLQENTFKGVIFTEIIYSLEPL